MVPYTNEDGVSWFFPTLYNWRRFCLPCTSEDTIKWVKSINPVQLKTISDIAYPLQLKTIQKYAINPVQLKTIWLYTGTQAPPIKSINPVQLKTIYCLLSTSAAIIFSCIGLIDLIVYFCEFQRWSPSEISNQSTLYNWRLVLVACATRMVLLAWVRVLLLG